MTIVIPKSQDIPSILIVDDTLANLDLLAGLIRDQGYEPRPFPNGKLALAAVQVDPPDLILLDINMPEMNGFEVCRRLKANQATREIPVIFITAFTEIADKVTGFSLGAVDYITKPFQVEEVRVRVETHLKIKSLQQQMRLQNENLERLVQERTHQLSEVNQRLAESGRLKDDFLRMISYEIRTPANGVLGIGELIIDLCPITEESQQYIHLFRESSLRLSNLIQDATIITEIEKAPMKSGMAISFSELIAEVRASLPEIQISVAVQTGGETAFLQGNRVFLKRALQTLIQLTTFFSRDRHTVHLTGAVTTKAVQVRLDIDALKLSGVSVDSFFELESPARAESPAESLGLAPVAAQKIISAFGGSVRLVKGDQNTGTLEVIFLRE